MERELRGCLLYSLDGSGHDESEIPVPPWENSPSNMPPGIIMSAILPMDFSPHLPMKRGEDEDPYTRLVLVSSRVQDANNVGTSLQQPVEQIERLPNSTVPLYNHTHSTWSMNVLSLFPSIFKTYCGGSNRMC